MEPTMRAFGMTWKEQPHVGGMIHHPVKTICKLDMQQANITLYFLPL